MVLYFAGESLGHPISHSGCSLAMPSLGKSPVLIESVQAAELRQRDGF